jgi:NitT/TauT family transport system permease protein
MPAALPSYLAGLKQGWAFAWRSLMAGELLVIIANRHALGQEMQFARDNSDAVKLISIMIVILVIGILVDVLFNAFDKRLRARRGILDSV